MLNLWGLTIQSELGIIGAGIFKRFEGYNDEEILFNSSWDWLMPVVEKIERLGASTEIHYFAGTDKQSFGTQIRILGYKFDCSIFTF